jgi:ribosomal protein S18 acetylase RimI-like enzyme
MPRIVKNEVDYLEWREGSGGTVEIYDIAVLSKRHQGVGRSLIEELKDQVRGKTHLIFAITRRSNHGAQKFYGKVGFRKLARLERFYVGEDALIFGLDL